MGMHVILMSFTATICLLADVATLASNSTTANELSRTGSLLSVDVTMQDVRMRQVNITIYPEPETTKVSNLISGNVDVTEVGKLSSQNSSIHRRKSEIIDNKPSLYSISQLETTFSLQNHTVKINTSGMLTKNTATFKKKRVRKRESTVNRYTYPASAQNDDGSNKIPSITEDGFDNKRLTRDTGVGGNRGLELNPAESVSTSAPTDVNTDVLIKGARLSTGRMKCSCDRTKCDYSFCNLTSVPQHLNDDVTELLLNNNIINIIHSYAFSHYAFLEILVLSNNNLTNLEDNAFYGLPRLTLLDIGKNKLGVFANLSDRIFEPLTALKVLRLDMNGVPCGGTPAHPDMFLAHLHSLQELYIANYGDEAFGPGFRNMTSLRNVTVSCYCSFQRLTNSTFQNLYHIKLLSIRECIFYGSRIEIGTFWQLTNLTTLDISSNSRVGMEYLPSILWGLKDSKLETLRMDNIVIDSSINYINSSIIQYLPQTLTTLYARENNIISIDRDAFLKLPKSLHFVDLSDNFMIMEPLDIKLEELKELETLLINSNVKECLVSDQSLPDRLWQHGFDLQQHRTPISRQTVTSVKKYQLGKIKIPGKLKRIQVNIKHLNTLFLLNIDKRNSLEIIDLRCSVLSTFDFTNIMNFPKLRFINLGRSSVRMLIFPNWAKLRSIKVLILESNSLNDYLNTHPAPFQSLQNLSHLDVSLNQISNLQKNVFYGLDNLEQLRLDGNTFSRFDANISNMSQLTLLNLSNTQLPNLPREVRSHIDRLCQARPTQITVDMSGCPIQCDCFNLDFLKWMVRSPAFDKNFIGYKCRSQDTSVKYILDGYEETIRDLGRECAKNYPVFLLILAATMILLSALTGTIIYRFRWKIRYLYYAAFLKVMDTKKKDREHEFAYDVFISYDTEDVRFVTRCLSPELENRGLKLLIHSRDFVAGTYIASNIVMAVAKSRKTLVVLTRNLLESTWCNYELQMATMEAVHTGRQVLMFLLKEDIPNRELDVELLRYIKTNTYLPYPGPEDEGDEEVMKRFYDKLAHDLKC